MTPLLFAGVAVAGGLGAAMRLLVDGLIRARASAVLPWGTLVINLAGSLLLGLVTGLAGETLPPWAVIVGSGFLGGFTTFSTASVEAVRLLQLGRWRAALVAGPGQLVAAVLLAGAGLLLGRGLA